MARPFRPTRWSGGAPASKFPCPGGYIPPCAPGLFAALVRSDLSAPGAAAKALSVRLLFAIGFKGGVSASAHAPPVRAIEPGRAGRRRRGMAAVACIVRTEKLDALLEAAFAIVERRIGEICVTDCEALRAERF